MYAIDMQLLTNANRLDMRARKQYFVCAAHGIDAIHDHVTYFAQYFNNSEDIFYDHVTEIPSGQNWLTLSKYQNKKRIHVLEIQFDEHEYTAYLAHAKSKGRNQKIDNLLNE